MTGDVIRQADAPAGGDDLELLELVRQMHLRARARELFARESAPPANPIDLGTLGEVLARPVSDNWRIRELMPAQASLLLIAPRKTGKSTWLLNLARALITGDQFLDRFDVSPISGRVAYLNFEVSAAQLARWANDLKVPTDRLVLGNLRGRRNPLGNPDDRLELASSLRRMQVETLVIDPFGRAFTGQDQNSAGDVGRFLVDLDRFAREEVGATDLILSAHAGWAGERVRGSSALEDWADVNVNLVRGQAGADDSDGDPARYMTAEGRDVELGEDKLSFDPVTRRLSLTGEGSRRDSREAQTSERLTAEVLAIVGRQPDVNASEVERQLKAAGTSGRKGAGRSVLRALLSTGQLVSCPGPRGAVMYRVNPLTTYPGAGRDIPPTPTYPEVPPGHVPDLPPPLVRGVGQRGRSTPATSGVGQAECRACDQPAAPGDPHGLCGRGDRLHTDTRRILGGAA